MKQKFNPWRFLVLITCSLYSYQIRCQTTAVANTRFHNISHSVSPESQIPAGAIEDESMRTTHSSFWRIGKQVIACYSSSAINYKDASGKLQPVNIALKSDGKGWVAAEQPNPCYLRSDRSTAISIGNGQEIGFNKNCTVNGVPYDQQISSVANAKVSINLAGDIHKSIDFVKNGIETSYTFDKAQTEISATEQVDFPAGYTFKKDEKKGQEIKEGWAGDYVLLSPAGREMARFYAPLCFDAKGDRCHSVYNLTIKDGAYFLTTSVPSTWLTTAAFPVTLDPLVMGPTSLEGGDKLDGSCELPSYSSDSLLVTIPGKITITDLDIDYSYTTVSTISEVQDMNIGRFYFSTSCGSSPVLYCDSAYPGTCYLVPNNDFHSPLTCCYDPLCVSQTFWLVAHLARTVFPGCKDTTIVWHDEKDTYPFAYAAFIKGYTDSITKWSVTPTTQCANTCELTLDANIEFGVPPYKVSHPWAVNDTVVGKYSGCLSLGVTAMKLKIPGCPYNCGKADTLQVPPPLVIDACNDTVKNIYPKTIQVILKPVPVITVSPDSVVICNGTPVSLNLNSCLTGTVYSWVGSDKTIGTSNPLADIPNDTGKTNITVVYAITGSYNGCNAADSLKAYAIVKPNPNVTVSGSTTILQGNSDTLHATGGGTYSWLPAIGLSCTVCPDPIATPTVTTMYYVTVTDSDGCTKSDSVLVIVKVTNPPITIPNVITPNGDGKNDYFSIQNLQYYPNSQLVIYDRWGVKVLSSDNYLNDWNGGGQSDGVYYYLLTLPTGTKYKGYLQIIK